MHFIFLSSFAIIKAKLPFYSILNFTSISLIFIIVTLLSGFLYFLFIQLISLSACFFAIVIMNLILLKIIYLLIFFFHFLVVMGRAAVEEIQVFIIYFITISCRFI